VYGGGGSLGSCSVSDKMRGEVGEAGPAILENDDGGGLAEEVVVRSDFPRLSGVN